MLKSEFAKIRSAVHFIELHNLLILLRITCGSYDKCFFAIIYYLLYVHIVNLHFYIMYLYILMIYATQVYSIQLKFSCAGRARVNFNLQLENFL